MTADRYKIRPFDHHIDCKELHLSDNAKATEIVHIETVLKNFDHDKLHAWARLQLIPQQILEPLLDEIASVRTWPYVELSPLFQKNLRENGAKALIDAAALLANSEPTTHRENAEKAIETIVQISNQTRADWIKKIDRYMTDPFQIANAAVTANPSNLLELASYLKWLENRNISYDLRGCQEGNKARQVNAPSRSRTVHK